MATIKPILNYRPNKQGRYTLILQIIHKSRRAVVFSPYHLLPEEFDGRKGLVVATNRTKAARSRAAMINEYIATQTRELHRVVEELEILGGSFTTKDITDSYRHRSDRVYIHTFVVSLCKDLELRSKHGTAVSYMAFLSIFERFIGDKNIRLDEITSSVIMFFEEYLKQIPLKRNTITFYMRILRSIYNKALRLGLVPRGSNPFEDLSFRMDKTRKLAISPETLRRIADANFATRGWLEVTRDIFMFSFYARGMSFVDMAYLKQDSVRNGVLYYTRRKTGQLFSVRINDALMRIIERYKNCSPWLLPVMKNCAVSSGYSSLLVDLEDDADDQIIYKRYKEALTNYWYYLGVISEELATEKRLTFNVARHSWASLARNHGIPVSVISSGLGHTSEKTTSIYLDELDTKEVDKANDIVTNI